MGLIGREMIGKIGRSVFIIEGSIAKEEELSEPGGCAIGSVVKHFQEVSVSCDVSYPR